MKKLYYLIIITIGACISSSVIAAPAPNTSSLMKEKNQLIQSVKTPEGKSWVGNILTGYTKVLKNSSIKGKTDRNDAIRYRTEVMASAKNFISDIKSGKYNFNISSEDKTRIENDIISYQQDLIKKIREAIQEQLSKDARFWTTLHFTVRSKEANFDLKLNPYNVTVSKDSSKVELDLTLLASGSIASTPYSEGYSGSINMTMHLVMIDTDAYITVQEFRHTLPKNIISGEMDTRLKKMIGITFHTDVSDDFGSLGKEVADSKKDSEATRQKFMKILDILERESILTPIASMSTTSEKKFVLVPSKATFKKIISVVPEYRRMFNDVSSDGALILYYMNSGLSLEGYLPEGNFSFTLGRSFDKKTEIAINFKERGNRIAFTFTAKKIGPAWSANGSYDTYQFDARGNEIGTIATVKKDSIDISTIKIDAQGINAWMYDISGIWEMSSYSNASSENDVLYHLWGTIRQEFGEFPILRPASYQELEKLLEEK